MQMQRLSARPEEGVGRAGRLVLTGFCPSLRAFLGVEGTKMGLDGRSGGCFGKGWSLRVPPCPRVSERPVRPSGACAGPGGLRGRRSCAGAQGRGAGPGAAPGPPVGLLGGPAASQQNRGTWGWPLGTGTPWPS